MFCDLSTTRLNFSFVIFILRPYLMEPGVRLFVFEMRFNDGASEVVATKGIFLPSQKGLAGLAISSGTKQKLSIFGVVIAIVIFAVFMFWTARHFKKKGKKAEVIEHSKISHRHRKLIPVEVW